MIETRDRNSSAPSMPATSRNRLPATTTKPSIDGRTASPQDRARRSQAKYSASGTMKKPCE